MPDPAASKRMKYMWTLIKDENMNKSQAFAKAYEKYPIKKGKSTKEEIEKKVAKPVKETKECKVVKEKPVKK